MYMWSFSLLNFVTIVYSYRDISLYFLIRDVEFLKFQHVGSGPVGIS